MQWQVYSVVTKKLSGVAVTEAQLDFYITDLANLLLKKDREPTKQEFIDILKYADQIQDRIRRMGGRPIFPGIRFAKL